MPRQAARGAGSASATRTSDTGARAAALPPPRVVIENVGPAIDGGRFAIKRTVGETVRVVADIHADGHDELRAVLRHRRERDEAWTETPMEPLGNDRWVAAFTIESLEPHRYTIEAWVDAFRTWRKGTAKKVVADTVEAVDLLVGAALLEEAGSRAADADAKALRAAAAALRDDSAAVDARAALALDGELAALAARHPDRSGAGRYERELAVTVDRERARFGAWYEMFPRSCAAEPGRYGTFEDCEKRLDYVASMGFDILYLPPIHPIGRTHRKGRNNDPVAAPGDVGSPWAIGAAEGGHKAVHPELGTLEDFRRLLERARERGLEVAFDLAYQCSPDHPWVAEHPQWFRWRPDGRVQYAENPPKKYEDIYPIHFESASWRELWDELKSVVDFWIEQGVRIFRVDNPHTKPFRFWEWMIGEVKRDHPEVVFLAEAFTRPRVMYQLAKLGFSQSYTYFAWRNTKHELTEYLTELTRSEVREYFRPNLWPNTPDILTEPLQYGGRALFQVRLVLAATLGASYGIYGPAFELCEARARTPGGEEYLDSEKYELRHWEIERADSLRAFIARVNRVRRENPALQTNDGLRFHRIDNDQLIAYSKESLDRSNVIVAVVNLDPHHTHSGWLELPVADLGLDPDQPYQVHDLLTEARYFWTGTRNFVQVDPAVVPAHLFRLRKRIRTERDFDYFL
jgi:starch synthase (maltosyl-transferring)